MLDFELYATVISMICMGHFSVEILGNVLFALEREKKQLVQEYDTLSMRVAVK